MRRYMIRTDLEGVSGIVSYDQAVPGSCDYDEGRAYFMSDLLAAINGLFDGGADEVYLYDEHCHGRNAILDELPENVYTIAGKTPYTENWAGGLDSEFDGVILLGFHSKADPYGYILNHSYDLDIRNIDINGISVGEIGNEAAIAGEFGVPFVMITADSKGVEEAQKLVPDVYSVSVKESVGIGGAVCKPLVQTRKEIYEAAKAVASAGRCIQPYTIPGPVTMTIDFYDTETSREYLRGRKNVVFQGPTVLSCWAQYLASKEQF